MNVTAVTGSVAYYPTFVPLPVSGNQSLDVDSLGNLAYQPSSGTLFTQGLQASGNVTGGTGYFGGSVVINNSNSVIDVNNYPVFCTMIATCTTSATATSGSFSLMSAPWVAVSVPSLFTLNSPSNGYITVNATGTYQVTWNLTWNGGPPYCLEQITVNGTGMQTRGCILQNSDFNNVPAEFCVTANAGQYLGFVCYNTYGNYAMNHTGTTVYQSYIFIRRG